MKFNSTISEYLEVSDETIIDKIYENWEKNKFKSDKKLYSEEQFFNNNEDKIKMPEWLTNYFKKNNIYPQTLGIDLPYYIENSNKNALKIAVFGINPLRRESDWKFGSKPDESFILSSAWGKHFGYVQKQNIELFKKLECEFTLYLSDIQKWFFKQNGNSNANIPNNTSSEKIKSFNVLDVHKQIVNKELALVEPHFILLIGNQSCKYFNIKINGLTKNKTEIFKKKFIVIPHTSNAVRENLKKQFAKINEIDPYNRDTLGRNYADLIIKTIKNNVH